MRTLLMTAMLLALGGCASTGNEAADAIINTAPSAVIWWLL